MADHIQAMLRAKLLEVQALVGFLRDAGALERCIPLDAEVGTFYYVCPIVPQSSYLTVEHGQGHSRVIFGFDG